MSQVPCHKIYVAHQEISNTHTKPIISHTTHSEWHMTEFWTSLLPRAADAPIDLPGRREYLSCVLNHPACCLVDHPPSKIRPLSSARQEAHTKESRSRVCAAFDVLEGQLSTSGRLRVLQVARNVQDRVIHAGCHSRPSQCQTGAIAPTHERNIHGWMDGAEDVNPGDRLQ